MSEELRENTSVETGLVEEVVAGHDNQKNKKNKKKAPKQKGKKNKLTGSATAKLIAYLILFFSILAGGVSGVATAYLWDENVYGYGNVYVGEHEFIESFLEEQMNQDAHELFRKLSMGNKSYTEIVDELCNRRNCMLEFYVDGYKRVSNYNNMETPYSEEYYFNNWVVDSEGEMQPVNGRVVVYLNPAFPFKDIYQVHYQQASELYNGRYTFPAVAGVSFLLFLFSFIFLMCGAGKKNGEEDIVPGVFTGWHFDILTVVFGLFELVLVAIAVEFGRALSNWVVLLGVTIFMIAVMLVVGAVYCVDVAIRVKQKNVWKRTLTYEIFQAMIKCIKFVAGAVMRLAKGLPLVLNTAIAFVLVSVVELFFIMLWGSGELAAAWMLEKILMFVAVVYLALVCKKLQKGSKALAEGDLTYKVDTSNMYLDFKEHGENLNQIGRGISSAVEERMKSERLKTELITNVSHDLKTPLTSIINYADLLGNLASGDKEPEREKLAEYSEVLLRQSKRLKKLLEDLVEASKATTGNLEVNLERCEVGVMLTQAVGEYEHRFAEKKLETITRQPENQVWIMADGRRLWRVFDNLLNNICKYAQEGSRVYLTVEQKETSVEIIFRNMSKYVLNLSAEELEERFVRGDKSRHMEGNGLGLSIAKSLVELQNGKLDIITDGDLFKVVLTFPLLEEV